MKSTIQYSLLAWIVVGVIFIWVLSTVMDPETAAVRVGSIILPQMVLFYLNLLHLTPKILEKGKLKLFSVMIALVIVTYSILGGALDIWLVEHFPIHVKHPQQSSILPYLGRVLTAIPPLVISTLIIKSMLLSKRTAESLELKNRMLEAETKALKAQINPHFLFNTLNNIYSLSQMKSDQTSTAIMNLSEILKYVTYEGNQNLVSLSSEVKQIENFIELQYLKDDDHSNISVEIDLEENDFQIAPLLLIPFIENSFKHSNHEDKDKGWIKIKIFLKDDVLDLICSNSIAHESIKKDSTGGVGMENVKKRLSLLYPEKHEILIEEKEKVYSVELKVKLSE